MLSRTCARHANEMCDVQRSRGLAQLIAVLQDPKPSTRQCGMRPLNGALRQFGTGAFHVGVEFYGPRLPSLLALGSVRQQLVHSRQTMYRKECVSGSEAVPAQSLLLLRFCGCGTVSQPLFCGRCSGCLAGADPRDCPVVLNSISRFDSRHL